MRLAFFSPLPPVKSGIADYSEALLEPLRKLAEVEIFREKPRSFDPLRYDAIVYQVGNNEHHDFVYEAALTWPGIVVMHEANLHHLIAEITIRRGDWDAYLAEAGHNGGAEALAYAKRVRALETGPDYEGVPMLRRILERSNAAIVHSHCVETEIRAAGFTGPVAVIPHGAWIPDVDRLGYRHLLGVEPATPLIGIFGFLKPYKRISEALRAFRRLVRVDPRPRMILVGEQHPDYPVASLIRTLDLTAHVRLLGFTPIEDFVGYVAACDVVLNLRYPTVGESSGSLLRALGLGRAVVVSDVGSFAELPDSICLKAPVDRSEEDYLFEYLNLLVSRPDFAREMGDRARSWVERECNWWMVAERYASFVEAVASGSEWQQAQPERTEEAQVQPEQTGEPQTQPPVAIEPESIITWAPPGSSARVYVDHHVTRLVKTLEITPPGGPGQSVLEMGAYLQITPALKSKLGYESVRGCYYGPLGKVDHRKVTSEEGEDFECEVDLFDAEKDCFPYPNEHFDTVLCCELLEHLFSDPMFMMSEINRILKPGGHLVLTTPNVSGTRALSAILQGYHPGFFPAYIRPPADGEEAEARHNREYSPREISHLLSCSGFEVTRLETGEFLEEAHPEFGWVKHMLELYKLDTKLRGDDIYAVGRKTGPVRERYPSWLYN